MSGYPDFNDVANEPCIDTRRVQEFLDWFECFDWSEIDEDDRKQIERARKFKELVTGEQVSDEVFENGLCVVVRENAFTEHVKNEEIELNESAWKAIPRVWQDNINWSEVASELRSDYAEIEWEGTTYLFEVND
jgi:hypothetical protein